MAKKKSPATVVGDAFNGATAKKPIVSRVQWSALAPPQRQVVAGIRQRDSCTREQLGALLLWSPSAVSKVVSPLLASEVLVSTPPGIRRRNARLSASDNLGFAVGIELGFAQVRAAVVDFNGHIVGQKREYRPDRLSPEAFLVCLQKVVRELRARPLPAP